VTLRGAIRSGGIRTGATVVDPFSTVTENLCEGWERFGCASGGTVGQSPAKNDCCTPIAYTGGVAEFVCWRWGGVATAARADPPQFLISTVARSAGLAALGPRERKWLEGSLRDWVYSRRKKSS
jgi:hypothetical protein